MYIDKDQNLFDRQLLIWTSSLISMQINYACFQMKYDDRRRILDSHSGGYEELYLLRYNGM
jgi:hypothetical protein